MVKGVIEKLISIRIFPDLQDTVDSSFLTVGYNRRGLDITRINAPDYITHRGSFLIEYLIFDE